MDANGKTTELSELEAKIAEIVQTLNPENIQRFFAFADALQHNDLEAASAMTTELKTELRGMGVRLDD